MALLKRLITAAFAGFVGLVLYVTFPVWSSLFASTPTAFTPDNWVSAHKYRRAVMAAHFLEHYPYTGMHQAAVIGLLGKPDQQTPGKLHYFVAITAADYMSLTFELDGEHRVTKAYLRQT
jgi:hypothetical protein